MSEKPKRKRKEEGINEINTNNKTDKNIEIKLFMTLHNLYVTIYMI